MSPISNTSINQPDFEQFSVSHLKVTKDGIIKKKSIVDKIVLFFISKFRQKEREKSVQAAFTNNLLKLHHNIIDLSIKSDEKKKEETEKLLKSLVKLNAPLVFDVLGKNQVLKQYIENIFHPDIASLRENKQKLKAENAAENEIESVKLAIRIEKAKLSKYLGIDFLSNKGATGTTLVRNLKGRYIGVFKPTHPHTPLQAKLLNSIKRIFGGQLYYLSHKTDAQSKAEVVAYMLDRHLGFGLTPSSEFLILDGKEGAFQSFFKGFVEAKDFMNDEGMIRVDTLPEISRMPPLQELTEFQKVALFDFCIGNLDRHEENWGIALIKTKHGGYREALKVIDNANAFLCKNPSAEGKVKNQYAWKNLNWARYPFTEEAKQFVEMNLKDEKFKEFFEGLKKDFRFSNFLSPEMEANAYQRLHVIQNLVSQENTTPAQLGSIVSDADMHLFE